MGKGVWKWGEREIIYLSLHCHHQNDSCIKMGSDESHFNVSVGSDGQSHKIVSTNHNLSEEKGEPKRVSNRGPSAYQPNAIPLGQTGGQNMDLLYIYRYIKFLARNSSQRVAVATWGVTGPAVKLTRPRNGLLQPLA